MILPAYTCFTVAASIVRSGLRLFPVDVDPRTLDFDFSQLESVPRDGVLCIVTSNLFGFVNDLRRVGEIARTKGAFVVDDAAQALGASRNGYAAGTRGDVGIFSLGRGKALPAIEGGLIVTNSEEIAGNLQTELAQVPSTSGAHSVSLFFQMLGFSAFLHPQLYWIPDAMPFLKLGATEYAPDFVIAGLPSLSRALLAELLSTPEDCNAVRRLHAGKIAEALSESRAFSTPMPAADCAPTYLRFPVIARDQATRDQAVAKLRAAGIGAGPFYPTAICDIPGIGRHMASKEFHRAKAESLAQRLFTVPVHAYVSEEDLRKTVEILSNKQFVEGRSEA